MVTRFTAVPVRPARVQPVQLRPSRLRGFGAVANASCPDAYGDDPCAAILAIQSPEAAAAAAGLPTSWLTTSTSFGGIPGWALLALGGGLLFFAFAVGGGRRR